MAGNTTKGGSVNSLGKKYYPYRFVYPALAFFVVFFIAPMIMGFIVSLTNWNMQKSSVNYVGLQNYRTIFEDLSFLTAVKNTVFLLAGHHGGQAWHGSTSGVVSQREAKNPQLSAHHILRSGVLSYVVVGILFSALFQAEGMVNNALIAMGVNGVDWLGSAEYAIWTVVLLDVWMFTGLHMIIYVAGLQGISHDYYEAAVVDGAGYFRRFWHITFPLLLPSRKINVVLSLVGGFKVFEQVKVLTNGGPGRALTR